MPDAANASDPTPMSRRRPLMAMTAVHALCSKIKRKLVRPMIQERPVATSALDAVTWTSCSTTVSPSTLDHACLYVTFERANGFRDYADQLRGARRARRQSPSLFFESCRNREDQEIFAQHVTRNSVVRLMEKRTNKEDQIGQTCVIGVVRGSARNGSRSRAVLEVSPAPGVTRGRHEVMVRVQTWAVDVRHL